MFSVRRDFDYFLFIQHKFLIFDVFCNEIENAGCPLICILFACQIFDFQF